MSTPEASPEAVLRDRVAAAHNRRTEELRREAEAATRRLADRLATAATFRLVFEGPGGGEWYLTVRDGTMRVETASDEVPVLTVFQTLDGWRRLLAAEASPLDARGSRPELGPDRVARLRALRGGLEFHLSDVGEGEPVSVLLQLGDTRERLAPATVLALRAEDATRIASGALPPQQAMLEGRVQIRGDVSLAIQVGTALFL